MTLISREVWQEEAMKHWAIEAHDRSGQVFLHIPDAMVVEIASLLEVVLNDSKTGGVVIYRPTLAVSNNRLSYCRYCRTTGGHTADCTVIS